MKNPPYHDIMKYMYIRTTHYNIKRTSSKLEKKENIWLDTYMKHESTNKKKTKKEDVRLLRLVNLINDQPMKNATQF